MIYVVIGILALVALVSVVLNVLLGTRKQMHSPWSRYARAGCDGSRFAVHQKLLLTKNEWAFIKKLSPFVIGTICTFG